MMAADAQRAAAASTQQGIQSAASALSYGIQAGVPLYNQGKVAKGLALEEQQLAVIRQRPEVQALKGVELQSIDRTKNIFEADAQRRLQQKINAEAMDPFSYAPSMYTTPLNLPKLK
jgi:hypothetical protein